jgi:1-acyl-sn-glycerol-3-phosphate acyltransferase
VSDRNRLRGWWKTLVPVLSLLQCMANFLILRLRGGPSPAARALWLHQSCQLVLRRLGFDLHVIGMLPRQGLLVSNHLSYLDILFYGAAVPCVFVAKSEVRRWPMLGLLAALGGTVFINRRSTLSAAEAASRIEHLLGAGLVVLVFPEGTSSDGSSVLRFYPSLFEPAVRARKPITAAAIRYAAGSAAAERDLCYYGDISFAPHLLQTLQLPDISATIDFADSGQTYTERKQAALDVHQQVTALRSCSTASVTTPV